MRVVLLKGRDMTIDLNTEPIRERRRRVPKAEASARLIEATIKLLRERPFDQVMNQAICAEADLNPSTILQHFGTLDQLLAAAAKELVRRYVDVFLAGNDGPETFNDPDVDLRNRLVAWMLLKGSNPAEYNSHVLERPDVIEHQEQQLKVNRRTAAAWTTATTMMVEAHSIFRGSHDLDEQEVRDILELFSAMRDQLPQIESTLGWDTRSHA